MINIQIRANCLKTKLSQNLPFFTSSVGKFYNPKTAFFCATGCLENTENLICVLSTINLKHTWNQLQDRLPL